ERQRGGDAEHRVAVRVNAQMAPLFRQAAVQATLQPRRRREFRKLSQRQHLLAHRLELRGAGGASIQMRRLLGHRVLVDQSRELFVVQMLHTSSPSTVWRRYSLIFARALNS